MEDAGKAAGSRAEGPKRDPATPRMAERSNREARRPRAQAPATPTRNANDRFRQAENRARQPGLPAMTCRKKDRPQPAPDRAARGRSRARRRPQSPKKDWTAVPSVVEDTRHILRLHHRSHRGSEQVTRYGESSVRCRPWYGMPTIARRAADGGHDTSAGRA